MRCPACDSGSTRTRETRKHPLGLRRRRECLRAECAHRFTTVEILVPERSDNSEAMVLVVDNHRVRDVRAVASYLLELLGGGS